MTFPTLLARARHQGLRWWVILPAALVLLQSVSPLFLKQGYPLTAFTDLDFLALILLATAAMLHRVLRSKGQTRFFWALMLCGCALWSISLWTFVYYEVIHDVPTPDLSLADVTLFLHLVPFITAIALGQPHRPQPGNVWLRYLRFLLLLLWWFYLYAFAVLPYQYLRWDRDAYNPRFDSLYIGESLILLVLLAVALLRTAGPWKKLYRAMFAASALYAFSSEQANAAMYLGKYFPGDMYDALYALGIAGFFWMAMAGGQSRPEEAPGDVASQQPAGSLARAFAVLAVLSIPAMGIWELLQPGHPSWLRSYRLALSFGAMLVVAACVFLQLFLQDRELASLLLQSQDRLQTLQRLQTELVRKGKLAALGQLVGGAAHEINNPLTAILGYSELLGRNHALAPEARSLAGKISDQARRTGRVVDALLSFAQRSSSPHTVVEIGPLLNQAIQAARPALEASRIQVEVALAPALPSLAGNAEQLLQVWRHLLNNAMEAQQEAGGGTLTITAELDHTHLVVAFADTGPGIREPERVFDPFYSTKPVGKGTGLGLSVCYGIVEDHHGQITCRNRPGGGAVFEVRLPLA